ncbi:hypothetical protein IQ06DRAFT_293482 [Phaeosphaeriaceae sp. SRC1lsM3a]|nr:hypothetical protein IQ06DRAFT_293482 [Stagonospora sp. SRC1lsM3a]
MAPKRGGGGGGSGRGGSINTCPNAFTTPEEQAYFANDVVFFAIFLGISIALCSFRKKNVAGKKLLGLPYFGAIFFFLLSYLCSIIATVLQQCETTDYVSYINWQIAIAVFVLISYWLLHFVVVFQLNVMLQKQLDRSIAIFKIIPAVLTGFMGLLTCGQLGLRAYVISLQASDDYLYGYSSRGDFYNLLETSQKYSAAYYALYFVTIIASGGLALMTILSLRKARKAGGDLIGWSVALTLAMMLWVIILIVFAAWALDDGASDYTIEKSIALSYVINFGQALSCIFILCIAKHASWSKPAHLEQYGQSGNPNGQPYYHQAPEFVGNTHTVKP